MSCRPSLLVLCVLFVPAGQCADPPPGFHRSPHFNEWVREQWIEGDVRVVINLPVTFDVKLPTRLVIFATPNGNTIEWTLGCATVPGLDWHYDIQHVSAQIRRLRELTPNENVVLACLEAEVLAWPAWRKKPADAPTRVQRVVDWVRVQIPGGSNRVTLTGHSGGGSFTFAFLDAADAIPDFIDRIVFLDSNYSYDDTKQHGDKLIAWLKGESGRKLCVIAYDDREITINGKKVVGPDGGTYRASQRMMMRFKKDIPLMESNEGDFINHHGLNRQLALRIHQNPTNKILHTALVGEMNGLLQGLTEGEGNKWGTFGGPRAYSKCVQPAPGIPPRPADAIGGRAFMQSVVNKPRGEREEAITAEILRGNIPQFLRKFSKVEVKTNQQVATIEVMPDYLSVGSDDDYVRVPMSPLTAQRIADAFGCALPTRKIVDDVYRQAALKLEPISLTESREAVATFVHHHDMIEAQRTNKELGQLVAGIKKDVVVTNRLNEKANRVALYGWHQLDGSPIQPLTVVHVNWYVDYSHGVRLMSRNITIDGKPRDVRHVLQSAALCGLLSDEGPILRPSY